MRLYVWESRVRLASGRWGAWGPDHWEPCYYTKRAAIDNRPYPHPGDAAEFRLAVYRREDAGK